jgi:hypothetical protein
MAAGSRDNDREPPFEGGSQPVQESRPEMPGPGRSAMQWVVIAIAVLVVIFALLWILVPARGA